MSEFLKSAFDYFGSGNKSKNNNELLGNCIEIGNQSFKVLNTIAEGGFSVVFEAQDVKTNKSYALKRLISHDDETNKEIMHEISVLKKLSSHPNIIKLFTAASIGQERQRHMGIDFLIVTELCTGGQVMQLMQRRNKVFPNNVTLQIFNHVAAAIEHMHNQNPPIIHRDLKVENLLINCHGVIKLCDFGSSTTTTHYPDNSWTGLKRSEVQEEIEKHTTPMYRSPEMLDLYQNYPINQACDIWALGCVLYYLCFNKHPFEDSAKLAILNANYSIPTNSEVNQACCGLIYQMLLIDPLQRPRIVEIINEIKVQASVEKIVLGKTIAFDKESLNHLPPLKPLPDQNETVSKPNTNSRPLPVRPQPPVTRQMPNTPVRSQNKIKIHPSSTASSQVTPSSDIQTNVPIKSQIASTNAPTVAGNVSDGKKMFGIIKEGAGNIMKNIRDASNKVIEQVSSSINKTDLDLTYVTSRIIMMPTPGETGIDILTRDKIEDIQVFLDFRHPNQYYIYNLCLRSIKAERFKDRVMQLGFDPIKPMSFNNLVAICIHQIQWLMLDSRNVIVVQCSDGRVGSGLNIAALLCFCRLVDTSSAAVDVVKFKRGDCQFTASHLRYIDYICRLMSTIEDPSIGPDIPHTYTVKLTSIEIEPVPIFNRAKTGTRPYVEIFSDYKLIYSNLKNYEDLSLYTYDHKNARISIPNVSVRGDLNVVLYHTRSNIVTKGKISSIKICEAQIYTGYLSLKSTEIILTRNQLDNLDTDLDKYPAGFSMKLQFYVTDKDEMSTEQRQSLSWNTNKFKSEVVACMPRDDRLFLFSNKEEIRSCMISADVKLPMKVPKPSQSKPIDNSGNFFNSLDWNSSTTFENDEQSVHSSPHKSESPNSGNFVNNNNENIMYTEPEQNEAVGNLLGDFGTDDDVKIINKMSDQIPATDVDGLADFFSALYTPKPEEYSTINNDVDLFNGIKETGETNNVNLLFFESSTIEKSDNFMFDPFGHNLVSSSSSTDITSNDWVNTPIACSQKPQPCMKPSNSTNSLLNITNSNPIKQSPSFNSSQSQQKPSASDFNIFENIPKDTHITTKPVPPPKPSVDKKLSEKLENVSSKKPKDAFKDLLGDFKPSEGSANGQRTIRDIRKEKLSKTTDPETMKILDWTDGKEKNIRALLCTLPVILWSDVKWPGVSMSELITVDQVKKAYRNAIRCVHPDKWNNTEHEHFAKMIMIELNEAMSEFEAEKNACSSG